MKRLLFLLFLLLAQNKNFAQSAQNYIIILTPKKAKKIIGEHPIFEKIHIETIEDNRLKKGSLGTLFSHWDMANLPSNLEGKDLDEALQIFLDNFQKEENHKKTIIAKINTFTVGQFSESSNLNYIYLDINFHQKNKDGTSNLVGHYHGRKSKQGNAKVISSLVYKILEESFNALESQINKPFSLKNMNYIDSNYVPQKGLYRTFLDYKYNTPIVTQEEYKILAVNETEVEYSTYSDSLRTRMFGYSDGKTFYSAPFVISYQMKMKKLAATGRYLYAEDCIKSFSEKEKKAMNVGAIVGGLSGALIVSATFDHRKDAIFDVETAQTIIVDSPAFISLLKENEQVLASYKEKPCRKNAIEAILKLNVLYHNKQLKIK